MTLSTYPLSQHWLSNIDYRLYAALVSCLYPHCFRQWCAGSCDGEGMAPLAADVPEHEFGYAPDFGAPGH